MFIVYDDDYECLITTEDKEKALVEYIIATGRELSLYKRTKVEEPAIGIKRDYERSYINL